MEPQRLLKTPGPMPKALAYQYMGEIARKQGDNKRAVLLLKRAVQDDPNPEAFEAWLLQCALACAPESAGAVSAMARAIFEEWRLAHSLHEFKNWLDQGAPSADADEGNRQPHPTGQVERQ